jgi:hypothetical protein
LYFLAQSFRAHLSRELPPRREGLSPQAAEAAHAAKALLRQLAQISLEIAQMVLAADSPEGALPDWFMVEIARDLPRIVLK